MTFLALIGAAVMVITAVVAVLARLRLWGSRLAPATPSPVPPPGPLVVAARSERGVHSELVPLLADWQLRGVLRTAKSGPARAASPVDAASSGPVWHFTAGPQLPGAHPVELIVLSAILGDALRTGDTVVVERDDVDWRVRVSAAIDGAFRAQRATFGAERSRSWALRPLIVVLAVVSGIATLVGAIGALGDSAALAWIVVGVPVVVTVTVLVALWPARSEAERRYLQAVRDLGAWVRTTDRPLPELGGWAMIWNLPGPWPAVLPDEVTGLLHLDRAFLRGDFASSIPEPFSLG